MPTGLIQTLSAERDKLRAEGNAIRTLAESAGSYTDEQREKRDALVARLSAIDADIAGEQALQAALMDAPVTAIVDGDSTDPSKAPTPFASLGEQLQAVMHAAKVPHATDRRLLEVNRAALGISAAAPGTGSNETVGFDGGFAVQSDFETGLMERILAGSQLAQYCDTREIGAGSNGIRWNVIDETSRADGSRGGGVQAYWIQEGGAITASRPKLARQGLDLGKLAAMWYVTDDLLEDATALESWGDAEFVDELAFKLDDAVFRGTGSGVPQGILNANALVSITKETNQTAATVVAENVEKAYAALPARSLGKAAWYINQEVWPQIFQFAHAVGTGGVPMFIPAGGLTDSPAGTLLGRPIRPIEQASALGTVGDIVLADLSRYLIIRKGGVRKASSIHVAFSTDEMAFRWILRVNGKPKPLAALTPYKGSQSTSPFVAIATRA